MHCSVKRALYNADLDLVLHKTRVQINPMRRCQVQSHSYNIDIVHKNNQAESAKSCSPHSVDQLGLLTFFAS